MTCEPVAIPIITFINCNRLIDDRMIIKSNAPLDGFADGAKLKSSAQSGYTSIPIHISNKFIDEEKAPMRVPCS
jgi:hypothetical protein